MSKTFTLHEAQTLIPVLDSLVRRAREAAIRGSDLDGEMQALSQKIYLSGGLHVDVPAAARRRAEHDKASAEVKSTVDEIEEIGVRLADLDEGVLLFPCTLEGRTVHLCWTLGEPEIRHWQETDDEVEVRRAVDGRFGRGDRPN